MKLLNCAPISFHLCTATLSGGFYLRLASRWPRLQESQPRCDNVRKNRDGFFPCSPFRPEEMVP